MSYRRQLIRIWKNVSELRKCKLVQCSFSSSNPTEKYLYMQQFYKKKQLNEFTEE